MFDHPLQVMIVGFFLYPEVLEFIKDHLVSLLKLLILFIKGTQGGEIFLLNGNKEFPKGIPGPFMKSDQFTY